MFNPTIISGKLNGLVGWRQPFNPDLPIIDAQNLASRSGYIVNDHAMAKVEYLKDSQDYIDMNDAQFNTLLVNKQSESIINVCNAVFNTPSYIDRQILYKNAMNKVDTDTLPDGFVGYRIIVSDEKDLAFEIKRCLLDFEGTGDVELLLFNTSQKAPIFTQIVNITSDHQELVLDWTLNNTNEVYKGDYYFGYLSNYINIGTLKPYRREYNSAIIESCISEINIFRGFFPSMNTNVLPDLETWDGMSETTGLNPDITVFDDYTDLITNNEFLFARSIQLSNQISVLEEIANSIRSNRNTRIGESHLVRILQMINGQKGDNIVNITGLRPQLYGALNHLRKEVEKLKRGYFGNGFFTETLS